MPVGLIPIDDATSVLRVDLHVLRALDRTAVLDSGRPEALENRIEFFLIDPKAEVLDRKRSVVVDEVEGQAIVDVYGRERPAPVSVQRTPRSSARRLAETR